MANIKQQFNDFRNNTPKHIQWLLLAAAFVIVIILLTMVLSHKSGDKNATQDMNTSVVFNVTPKHIDFQDVIVGKTDNKTVNVSVNVPVVIGDVTINSDEIKIIHNCDGATDLCTINVIYKPTVAHAKYNAELKINWYMESQANIINTESVSVTFNAINPKPVVEKTPVVAPVIEPVISEPVAQADEYGADADDDEYDEPDEIPAIDTVRDFATPNPFNETQKEPEILTPEKCSDFAIPGYDMSGRQIGWIKPEAGANYFHPFSDTDCSNPTGRYDFATGVITSLRDGSKLGTDSDHIGYRNVRSRNLSMPQLSMPAGRSNTHIDGEFGDDAVWLTSNDENGTSIGTGASKRLSITENWNAVDQAALSGSGSDESIFSSQPYDRTFILRQFKPIPATIVSEVRADPSVYGCSKAGGSKCDPTKNYSIPVRATVDRNVYSDDGRTIILPTGTLLMGYLDGELPGPYQAFGRMNIKWYQFIRPDGVEFNFTEGNDPYSADAQGRMGVPGHGSTDYVEQMVMPILTAMVPAAVNMIAPIADTVINQIDLDNNTVVQSGTIRSSEMAKQDIINTWNKITQKLLVDAIDNTVPPFSIAAGTRINVFSPVDLIVTCGNSGDKKCAFAAYQKNNRRSWQKLKENVTGTADDGSWVGQVRSFNLMQYCKMDNNGKLTIDDKSGWGASGYDYRTVLLYCESQNYQAKNAAKQNAYNQNLQNQAAQNYGTVSYDKESQSFVTNANSDQITAYNTEVLGLTYDEDGNILNPFENNSVENEPTDILTCEDGNAPDMYGCCTGETYTDNGPMNPDDPDSPHEFVCCPAGNGDCFPPIIY